MGCGKSSVGFRLAQKLNKNFIDLDQEIESQQGTSVSEIFRTKGESYFRELEHEALEINIARGIDVIATGGGAFINKKNRNIIRTNAISLWIRADLDILYERVSRKNTRPILENVDKKLKLKSLIEERYPVYEQADLIVDTTHGEHDKVVDDIINKVELYQNGK